MDLTNCQFKFYTKVTTDEEDTADFNEWVNCRPFILMNGDFSDGTTGWVQMQESNGYGSTLGSQGWQIVAVESGATYQFSCDYDRAGVNPSIAVKADSETGASLLVFNPIADGWNNVAGQFTTTSTRVAVHFGNGSDTALFDNVLITKV